MQGNSTGDDLVVLRSEVDRLREREAATRSILKIIGQSPSDAQPVFDVILENAVKLCGADRATLLLANKERTYLKLKSTLGQKLPLDTIEHGWPIDGPHAPCQAVRSGKPVHLPDLRDGKLYKQGDPTQKALVDDIGLRSALAVPLLGNEIAIGAIVLHHLHDARAYSKDEIWLIETFAKQAVIAIENVSQFREVQERLEREAATSKILEVINRSRDDDGPVFDVVLENAAKLCGAPSARLMLANKVRDHFRVAASWGEHLREVEVGETSPLDPALKISHSILNAEVIHQIDLRDSAAYKSGHPVAKHIVDVAGVRTLLTVPLISGDYAIGCIALSKLEVAAFSDSDIALVETFAAQAVIAIENARQFRDLQARLEREAATREILSVISQSRDDDTPVFNILLENAARLCDAPMARLHLVDEDRTYHRMVAVWGESPKGLQLGQTWPLSSSLPIPDSINGNKAIFIDDFAKTRYYLDGNEVIRNLVDAEGFHSYAVVPLLKDGLAIGCITLTRRSIVPFAVDDIALVETFAEQAVIAIENARQFKALESLNAELGDRVEKQVGEIERMGKLKRFLPAAVADAVVSSGSDKLLSSHRALLSVLFCDIRGFTAFCESAEPEETIEVLQTYHMELGKLINQHGAGVDHRMGDGIMVLFNDPLPCDDPAGDAVQLALAMQEKMVELCNGWKRLGHRLGFGVGISLGYATVGLVGYEERSEYTASGTAVNLAARLCDRAEDGEILISPRAYTAIEDNFSGEPTGEVSLKGIREPVEIYRLIGAKS